MDIYLDEDSASRRLSTHLRKAGHNVSIPVDLGISVRPISDASDASDS